MKRTVMFFGLSFGAGFMLSSGYGGYGDGTGLLD